jgi:hypothetical protein
METKETMHKSQERGRRVLHEAFEYIGKAAGTSVEFQRDFLKMQGDLLYALVGHWHESGTHTAPDLEPFQGHWTETMDQLLKRRLEVLDLQYRGALETLEQALHLAQTSGPEAFAEKVEECFRTTLTAWRQSSEAQLQELHEAAKSLMEIASPLAGKPQG